MPSSAPVAAPVVMAVDDDSFVGRAVACILQEARRAQVHVARSGDEALALLEGVVPDLVLLDINMPGMEIVELCRRLRAHPTACHAAICVLTGMLPGPELVARLQPYVTRLLTKPPDPVELVRALDECRKRE